jgi:uncharacterized protein YqjF (DUF2071 family)
MTDAILREVSHRPWPLPTGPWVMFQSWQNLLFAHWRVDARELRPLIPEALILDEYDGSAWLGLTPFIVRGLRGRFMPPLPGISEFPEMNLRTYVRVGAKPGIFFFTLDAASRLAVAGARLTYRLPYRLADMSIRSDGEWIQYRSRRAGPVPAELIGRYRPVGDSFEPQPGTREHFLTERYALYTVVRDRILRGEIHHPPWRIHRAEAHFDSNTVIDAHGIRVEPQEPLLHFSARQDTLIWPPTFIT